MARRHELTDAEWGLVEPHLPLPSRGRAWADHRRTINGVLFWASTGIQWRAYDPLLAGRTGHGASTPAWVVHRHSYPRPARCHGTNSNTQISVTTTINRLTFFLFSS